MVKRLLVLGCLLPSMAFGAVIHLNWIDSAVWNDQSALPGTAITQTRVAYGSCVAGALGVMAGQVIAPGGLQHADTPDLPPGTYCFVAYTTAGGQEGDPSNVATITIAAPPLTPGAPTQLTATP